jgi:hypothetical protein
MVVVLSLFTCGWLGYGQTEAEGNLISFVEVIRNAMPGISSNGFVIPTNDQLTAFAAIITDLKNQNYASIQSQLSPYEYQFIKYHDISSNDTVYILKENIPVHRGWGTYMFNPKASQNLVIQSPHPVWDTKSWRLAAMTFLALDAQWFFMAGTHRYANTDSSSDMAHVTRSVFHRAHQTVAADRAIQIHGFNNDDPSYSGYPDIVISSGNVYPPNILFTLKSNLESKGFTAGVYSLSTQSSLSQLAATTNKQGQWSNANGKSFVHIEFDTPIRTDSAKSVKARDALVNTFLPVAGIPERTMPGGNPFTLYPNYPNPFNPATTISFYASRHGLLTLKIFDIQGKEVTTLVNETLPPGIHTRTWDVSAKGIASGIYFYRLTQEGHSEIKKMILIQ